MKKYLVCYITQDDNYSSEIVLANDLLQAYSRSIPNFKNLLLKIKEEQNEVDNDYFNSCLPLINLFSYTSTELEEDYFKQKSKIFAVTFMQNGNLQTLLTQSNSKIKALLSVFENQIDYTNEDFKSALETGSLSQIKKTLELTADIRVLEVITLTNLIKKSI